MSNAQCSKRSSNVQQSIFKKTIMQKQNLKKSFTLVELMTPDYQQKVGVGASRNCKRSFTLVELMIVIAILAIISAIVVFALNPTNLFKRARDSRRLADINTLYKAISFMES